MTEPGRTGHTAAMTCVRPVDPGPDRALGAAPAAAHVDGGLPALYDAWVDFVWRSLRRLGVAEASLDDAVQDVFLVVHRRLAEFEGRSSPKTWLFGIALRVARDHRRTARRRGGLEALPPDLPDDGVSPCDALDRKRALGTLDAALAHLDDDRRAVLVMMEIEEMTAPEVAEVLEIKLNTVYSRLRLARRDLDAALAAITAQRGGAR